MDSLPTELLERIVQHLHVGDLFRLMTLNRRLEAVCRDHLARKQSSLVLTTDKSSSSSAKDTLYVSVSGNWSTRASYSAPLGGMWGSLVRSLASLRSLHVGQRICLDDPTPIRLLIRANLSSLECVRVPRSFMWDRRQPLFPADEEGDCAAPCLREVSGVTHADLPFLLRNSSRLESLGIELSPLDNHDMCVIARLPLMQELRIDGSGAPVDISTSGILEVMRGASRASLSCVRVSLDPSRTFVDTRLLRQEVEAMQLEQPHRPRLRLSITSILA